MMRLIVCAIVATCVLSACAGEVRADTRVDTAYTITGSAAAAPVQAFQVNGRLYLQLQNIHRVPAPFSPAGSPLPYRVYGPYIVLYPYPQIVLRYAGQVATVTSAGDSTALPAATAAPPVNAANPGATLAPPPPPPSTFNPSDIALAGRLSGSITSPSADGAVNASGFSSSFGSGGATVANSDAESALSVIDAHAGASVEITADGTVAGAEAAQRVVRACGAQHLTCHVTYSGAPAGQLMIEETP
ncbi:MAG TPA: TrbG/VirB9 family P-type conjugative transfer protein [Nevskiaceae bacterium]|nr:TrbG/VirB9 family P-type conjugative transfer protein [Nevskiaceae bacterium]